ncbi:MAG: lysophospholipid acyltransferase family protein [Kiritimatiellia bacterium]
MARRLWIRAPRSVLGGCFFVLYGLGSLLIGGLLFPPLVLFGARRAMRALVRFSWRLFVWGGRWTGLFRVEVSPEDRRRLAATRGHVIVANHLTLIDVVVLTVFLPDATAIAKAAARGNFFYSLIVRGVFLLNDDPQRVLEAADGILAEGVNLIVFPQGTRVPAGAAARPLRRGAAQIALHAGAPILPVTIACDPPVLARGQPWYDLADRTIVWRLRVHAAIPAPPVQRQGTHAAAVALTETIRSRLGL